MDPDRAFENLNSIIANQTEDQIHSEADTRCKVIDRIFIDTLSWEQTDIERELKSESGYSDYVFSVNNIPFFVVEAKRLGEIFIIPKSFNKRRYKIGGTISSVENLSSAITQARNYCLDIGVKYAVVTNGTQYVLFPTFGTNKKWTDVECVIFKSLEDIKNHFSLFWNMLEKSQVTKGSLYDYLEKGTLKLEYKKIYYDLHNRDQQWSRNRLYTFLRPICDFVFTELLDEAKASVLKECYVFERSNRNLGSNLDDLFIDKLPYFASDFSIKDIFEREKKAGVFEKEFEDKIQQAALILLLGGVGSGKSTFLHRFFKNVQGENLKLFWFYFDFRESPFDESKIEDYLYTSILRQYEEKYSDRVEEFLQDVGFSRNEDLDNAYVYRLFRVLKRLGISIVLIVDNVDQHEYNFQEKLFIYSNHISKELEVLTILSIREETFLQSTQSGVLDAYDVPKFHISSPNFLNLIRKRIDFSIDLIQSGVYEKGFEDLKPEIKNDLIHYFKILKRSLEKENSQSRKIIRFFDNISVGNMREALSMFQGFLISGNTNINEMFQKEKDDKDVYQIAFHQLLKSIMLDEYRFYCSERSRIANLFDFDLSLDNSHFNKMRIIKILIDKENSKSRIGRGYFEIDELIKIFELFNISKDTVIDSLRRLSSFNLIVYDNQSKTNVEYASYVKVTASGKLYYSELIYQFGYLDAIIVDTPISNNDTYVKIRKIINSDDLVSRLNRTKLFIEYLKESEQEEVENNTRYINNDYVNNIFTTKIVEEYNSFVTNIVAKDITINKEQFIL